MSTSKTFLLLPHRIPASEELLALITTNPLSPLTSTIVPAEPLSDYLPSINTPSTTLTTVDVPGSLSLSVSKAISFSLSLEPVLSLSTNRGNRVRYAITSREIKKSRLRDPGGIFSKLLENSSFKNQLMALLPRKAYLNGRRAYFIIGTVTAIDATVTQTIEGEQGVQTHAQVPLDAVVGVPLPLDVGIGGGVETNSTRGSTTTSHAVGNDIWGVEYMEIRRDWWNAEARLGRQVEKVKGGRFFANKPNEESEEDEEEEDEWGLVGGFSSQTRASELECYVAEVKQ